jgi:hypothetical protein
MSPHPRRVRIVPALVVFALGSVVTGLSADDGSLGHAHREARGAPESSTVEVDRAGIVAAIAGTPTWGRRVHAGVLRAGFSRGPTAGAPPRPAPRPDPAVRRADPTEVDWRMLAGLNYRTGEMTDELEAVVGGQAKVPGFMVPLEDYLEEVTEFLLVPYVGACVHTPPPPPNQLVYVKMAEGKRVTVEWWDPIYTVGTLILDETENQYASVSYTMEAQEILPYEN